jgi:hypothetical protein
MKTARATLSSMVMLMLTLSMLAPVAMAQKTDPADLYKDSDSGTVSSGVIKSLRDCPVGTDAFFKNVNPFISGGPGGEPGELQFDGTFLVDGSEVRLSVFWKDDNSFRFKFDPDFSGIMYAIGPEVDNDKLIYTYPVPVFEDAGLNVLKDGTDSADVNHLDLCISLVDSTPPSIEFISPLPGDTVSGTVTVQVRVTDDSGVDSVAASVYPAGGDPASATPLKFVSQDGDVYTWTWTSLDPLADPPVDFASGSYTIAVTATDQAVPATNTITVDVTVELVKSLTNCFGILGNEDFPGGDPTQDGYANGCQPTPLVNVQAPPDSDVCNVQDPPAICYLSGTQLIPDPGKYAAAAAKYDGCDACAPNYCGDISLGQYGIPDPRMQCTEFDALGNCTGEWIPKTPLQPLYVTDVVEGTTELVLGKYVYGFNGCFAASQHVRGGTSIADLYTAWPQDPPTGLVFIKTHTPAAVIPPGLVAACNFGELDASQAGYQPVNKVLSVDTLEDGTTFAIKLVATQRCVNPARTLTRDNGIDVSNIIETDGSGDPVEFKYQMAQMQFDALFAALECAEPTFLRGKVKFSDVSSPINQAKAQFDNGTIAALERARDDLGDAALAIRTGNWDVTAENCAGDALARTENLAWRMTDILAALGVPVPQN